MKTTSGTATPEWCADLGMIPNQPTEGEWAAPRKGKKKKRKRTQLNGNGHQKKVQLQTGSTGLTILTRRETGRGKHVKREKSIGKKKGNALKRDVGSAGADLVLFGHNLRRWEKKKDKMEHFWVIYWGRGYNGTSSDTRHTHHSLASFLHEEDLSLFLGFAKGCLLLVDFCFSNDL